MKVLVIWIVFGSYVADFGNGASVIQTISSVVKSEGEAVTFRCDYDSTLTYYYLFWYRQQQGKGIEFVMRKYSQGSEEKADFAETRFSADLKTTRKYISLSISALQLRDSGIYYCGFSQNLGYYYEKLIFGSGTKLIVEPKPKAKNIHPQPLVLYPPLSQGVSTTKSKTAAVCLLSDFYPKKIELFMAINETVNVTTPSRLNDNGFYVSSGYLQFPHDQDLENITCTVKHENQEKNNTIQVDKRVPETVDKPNCEIQKSSNQNASVTFLLKIQLRWVGHISRMEDHRLPKIVLYGKLSTGHCDRGAPKKRYFGD